MNKPVKSFSHEAMLAIKAYEWPGNVRELENAVERAVVVCRTATIEKEHLPVQTTQPPRIQGRRLEDVERNYIDQILHETGWNISRAATLLDIDRVTLYHKIEKFQLKRGQ
jgi:DNA-binding NtrC family response regulator